MMNSVNGQRTRRGGYYLYYPPLGLCSIAGAAQEAGFRARIFDGQFEKDWPDCVMREAVGSEAALAGVLTTTPTLPVVKGLVDGLRRARGEAGARFKIVAGGPHISCDPEIVPELGADFGAVGDGEGPVVALAALLMRGDGRVEDIPGLVWLEGDSVRVNAPCQAGGVKSYPAPARELLRREKYFNPFFPTLTTSVISARGCPFQCAFCCRSQAMGAYRPRPVEAFLDEMGKLQRQGYGFVSVIDETFTYDRARASAIAEGLIGMGPKFKWSCQTRADTVDAEILSLIKRAGCINISFGIEAGDSDVRMSVDKSVRDEDFVKAFSLCRKLGISTNAFIMIGNPGEGEAEIMKSIEFARRMEPDYVVFNIGTLFPGSRVYEQLLKEAKISRRAWSEYMLGRATLPVLSDRLGKPELVRLLHIAFMKFYLKPGYVLRRLKAVRSPRQAWHLLKQAGTIVGDYVF